MIDFPGVEASKGWFQETGESYDVILSSRTRLSRNLASHRFPLFLKSDEENEVQSDILSAFQDAESAGEFQTDLIGELAPLERRIMMERNYITQQFSLHGHKAAVLGPGHTISGMINEIDHLRLSCLKGGLSLKECWKSLDQLDTDLEDTLDYAVSLEVTHHGPTGFRTPLVWAELGSTEKQWGDKEAAAFLVGCIEKGSKRKDNAETVIGFGGGHYAPKFSLLEEKVAFGHMCPKYACDLLGRGLIEQMVEKSGGVDYAVLDDKGLKGSQKATIRQVLDEIGVEY